MYFGQKLHCNIAATAINEDVSFKEFKRIKMRFHFA